MEDHPERQKSYPRLSKDTLPGYLCSLTIVWPNPSSKTAKHAATRYAGALRVCHPPGPAGGTEEKSSTPFATLSLVLSFIPVVRSQLFNTLANDTDLKFQEVQPLRLTPVSCPFHVDMVRVGIPRTAA
jgi:hypothetical protein